MMSLLEDKRYIRLSCRRGKHAIVKGFCYCDRCLLDAIEMTDILITEADKRTRD